MLKKAEKFEKIFRLESSLRALERVRDFLSQESYERLRELVLIRLKGIKIEEKELNSKVAVAFSGGSDSSATYKILAWAGFKVYPITAKLPQMRDELLKRLESGGAIFVEIPEYMEVMEDLIRKRTAICGRCHSMVMRAVEERARELGAEIVASGDMLTVGSGSIYEKDGIVILNLPAFLALDKKELLEILGWKKYELKYGCPLWKEAAKRAPVLKKFGLQRVLRELRGGALPKEFAKELIIDILRA